MEENGLARFPDAPTQRGLRHIRELTRAVSEGYRGTVIFVVQMERADWFAPNTAAQPDFAGALAEARAAGVELIARLCRVTPREITLGEEIPVKLEEG